MPTITEEISGRDALTRRRIKARRLAEHAAGRLPITWLAGQAPNRVAIAVTAASFDGEALRLHVTASRGAWNHEDQVIIINPPVLAPDGGTRVDENGHTVPTFAENPAQAIRLVIEDVVATWRRGER